MILRDVYVLMADGRVNHCDVHIHNGVYEEFGSPRKLEPKPDERMVDYGGRCGLIPSFFNGHCHTAMTLMRGLGEEKPLMRWLEEDIFPIEAHLTPKHVECGARQGLAEQVLAGCGGTADMYYHIDRFVQAVDQFGLRCLVGRSWLTPMDAAETDRCHYSVDPHAHYTLSFEDMSQAADFAFQNQLSVQTHFLEAPWERQSLHDRFGMTPLEYLEKTGLLKTRSLLLAHCVYLLPEEAAALAERGNVTAVHCPASNLKLGSGFAPIKALREQGLPIAIGTDGSASNNRLDMWAEVRLAALLAKGLTNDPSAYAAQQVFHDATVTSAKACGFEKVGLIGEGFEADYQVLDLTVPEMCGIDEHNFLTFLIYAGTSAMVRDVAVAGREIVKDGQFLPLSIETINQQAKAARDDLRRLAQEARN